MTAPRELTNVRVESLSLDDQANAWGHPPPQVVTAPTTRTDGIDFAVIFARAITDDWPCDVDAVEPHPEIRVLASPGEIAESVLAANVPELCPDLTIGQMLREWQALTALVEYATHHDWNCPRPGRADCACGLDAARAALEAVRCSEDT